MICVYFSFKSLNGKWMFLHDYQKPRIKLKVPPKSGFMYQLEFLLRFEWDCSGSRSESRMQVSPTGVSKISDPRIEFTTMNYWWVGDLLKYLRSNKFFKIYSRYPEDKVACEHICDTVVYECLNKCSTDTSCYRDCWIEHDKCTINCPCNDECLNGCPEPFDGHPCNTWFCQGHVLECATEDDSDREFCPYNSQDVCLQSGCCWTHSDNPAVPWCHHPKKHNLPSVWLNLY